MASLLKTEMIRQFEPVYNLIEGKASRDELNVLRAKICLKVEEDRLIELESQ